MVVVAGLRVVVGLGHQGFDVVEEGARVVLGTAGGAAVTETDGEEPAVQPALSGQSQRSCTNEDGYQ